MSLFTAKAESLVVYSIMGKVELVDGQNKKELNLRAVLKPESIINIPYRSCVVLYDAQNAKQYTLKTPGHTTVRNMINDSNNGVRTLTGAYLAFISQQITSGKQKLVRNCSDPATVTRELMMAEGSEINNDLRICGSGEYAKFLKDIEHDLKLERKKKNDDFESFRQQIHKDYEDFRRKITREYAEAVSKPWKEAETKPAEENPKDDKIKPVIFSKPTPVTKPKPQDKPKVDNKPKAEDKPKVEDKPKGNLPVKEVIKQEPKPSTRPAPIAKVTPNEDVNEGFSFTAFGTKMMVRLSDKQKFRIASVEEKDIQKAVNTLNSSLYDNVLYDLLKIRANNKLSDWGYYQVVVTLSNAFLGKGTNEATFFTTYLMMQSGYKVRMCRIDNKLHLMMSTQSKHHIYGLSYMDLPEGRFYIMDSNAPSRIYLCNVAFTGEKNLSLYIPDSPVLSITADKTHTMKSKRFPNVTIEYTTNNNLMDFYQTYPSSMIGNNKMTRWAMYANTPMDPYVASQIYPQLMSQLDGLNNKEKVSRLLDLCQNGLVYGNDEDMWGHDRVFFAEETMHYAYSDCEDHSVLFTRLVRDLVGLDCILIYYPGHIAAGVCFGSEEVDGDSYEVNGRIFTVCDPTYINSDIGMSMPGMAEKGAEVIVLERK